MGAHGGCRECAVQAVRLCRKQAAEWQKGMHAAPHAPASMVYLLIVCTHVGALASTFNITGGSLEIVTRTQSMEEKWKGGWMAAVGKNAVAYVWI